MRPIALIGENVGTYPSLRLDFRDGVTALSGSNGAGKSTILRALEAALFADGARDLSPMLGPHGDRMEIELTFEHDGDVYRVRRGFNGKRATLDFEGLPLGEVDWIPLTRETTAATQAEIERILGLNRQTFNASAYLAQGNAGAFPQAKPAERKALIGAILDPAETWPKLANKALAERRIAETALQIATSKIADLQAMVDTLPAVAEWLAALAAQDVQARAAVAEAEQALESAQARLAANAVAAERVRTLTAERDHARERHARASEALGLAHQAAAALPAARAELHALREQAERVPELEAAERAYAEAVQAVTARRAEKAAANAKAEQAEAEARDTAQRLAEHISRAGTLAGRLTQLEDAADGHERCAVCEQTLGAESRQASIRNVQRDYMAAQERTPELEAVARDARTVALDARKAADAITVPDPPADGSVADELAGARTAAAHLIAAEHKIGTLEHGAAQVEEGERFVAEALVALGEADRALAEASEGVADHAALANAVTDAKRTRAAAYTEAEGLAADLARARAEHEQIQDAGQQLAGLVEETAGLHDRLDLLRLAERCYGRDGVPALIVENTAVPAIEAEANRILERLPTADGTVFRVELRTQAALKSDADRLRETLDIVVSDTDGERAYETYSGGEQARLNVALRVALALLLARRRGAESRLLALDELEYLDEQGQEALVGVLREMADSFDQIVIVSHSPGLRDSFDATLAVEKVGGVSRLAVAS